MDSPDYDIRVSLYLTGLCRMSRIEVDLSDITEGASMIIDGTAAGTCILSYEMPNGERLTLTYVRNPSVTHVNFIYMDCLYETDQGDNFTASGYITTQPDDNGCEINVKNLSVMQGDDLLGTFSFIGTITKEKICRMSSVAPTSIRQTWNTLTGRPSATTQKASSRM